MKRIRWTKEAAEDLASIRQYIERDSPRYARLTMERLIRRAEEILDFPEAGRIVPELDRPDVREVILGTFRIVYQNLPDVVRIVTIFNSSMQLRLREEDL